MKGTGGRGRGGGGGGGGEELGELLLQEGEQAWEQVAGVVSMLAESRELQQGSTAKHPDRQQVIIFIASSTILQSRSETRTVSTHFRS